MLHFTLNNIKAGTLSLHLFCPVPLCSLSKQTGFLLFFIHTLVYSLKQETLNAVSLACTGSVRKRSDLNTSFALGGTTWRGWKASNTCLQVP